MYLVKDMDQNEIIIKRLSKYEKEVLKVLGIYQGLKDSYFNPLSENKKYQSMIWDEDEDQYLRGRRVPIWMLKRDLNIKHPASLSRLLSTMERKGLIFSYGYNMRDWESIDYKKYICLSCFGEQVLKQINFQGPGSREMQCC